MIQHEKLHDLHTYVDPGSNLGITRGRDEFGEFEFAGEIIRKVVDDISNYLVKPFMQYIDRPDYLDDTNHMKIMTGPMGSGKTDSMMKHWVPALYKKHDLKLVIASAPQQVILNVDEMADRINDLNLGIHFALHPYDAIRALKRGRRVFLAATHQSNGVVHADTLTNFLVDSGIVSQTGLIVDEAHMWMVSHKNNLPDVAGSSQKNYNASMYKFCGKIAGYSPHVFGITATQNREHDNIVDPIGNMQFSLINSLPPLAVTIYRQAWLKSATFYNLDDPDDTKSAFFSALDVMKATSEKTKAKRSMLINCGSQSCKYYHIDDVIEMINEYASEKGEEADPSIIVMTHETVEVRSPDGSYVKNLRGGDAEALECLNDPYHSAKYALIIEKGKAGMTIFNLKEFFSFRKMEKNARGGVPLLYNQLQIIGRPVRVYTGMENSEFVKRYKYDLRNYISNISEDDKERLLLTNSFNVTVPSTDNWKATLNEYANNYGSTVDSADKWIADITGYEKSKTAKLTVNHHYSADKNSLEKFIFND